MQRVTQGDVENAIWDLEEYFGVNYNGLTNRECIENLRGLCPKLHSEDELKTFSDNLLSEIFDEFGFKGLRIWYAVSLKYGFCVYEDLYMKYDKLVEDISRFVESYRKDNGIVLKLDVFLSVIYLKETYKRRFGVFNEELVRLHSILQTIHLSDYNPIIISEVGHLLEMELAIQGDKYYYKQDLSDRSVLEELYIHVGEEFGDADVYTGLSMFYDYDGYGGLVSPVESGLL